MITILKNINLVDVKKGLIVKAGALEIRGERITFAGESKDLWVSEKSNEKTEVLDLAGKYVLPGLINMHDHLYHRAFHRGVKPRIQGLPYGDVKK
ncbi:MAG: hypothetical protein EHM26_09905, partial [Desulfobacteraceae bacterium]